MTNLYTRDHALNIQKCFLNRLKIYSQPKWHRSWTSLAINVETTVKLVTIILYMYIVYISLIDKCELMTFILYTCIVSKVMIG